MAGETSAPSPRSQAATGDDLGQESTGTPPPRLLGLGVCTLDCVQTVSDFPQQDQVIHCQKSLLMGGGPVATALVTAARLGTATAMIDRIGDDWRGEHVRSELELAGVDTRWLTTQENATTAFANVMARESDAARAIVFSSGSAREFSTDELADVPFDTATILHLNGRHWPACLDAAERMHSGVNPGMVSFDGGAHRYRDEICELLARVDIAIVADDFSRHLNVHASIEARLDTLLEFGVSIAGITDGERGSWFATPAGGENFHQAAFPIERAIDTTGCGDVFHGAFLAEWLHTRGDLKKSARLASAAAALNATALGGRGRLAERSELDHYLAAHPNL